MNTTRTQAITEQLRETGCYHSPPAQGHGVLPTLRFYSGIIYQLINAATRSTDPEEAQQILIHASLGVLSRIENLGGQIHLDGLKPLLNYDAPVVLVGNHMSSLETFTLPGILLPFRPLTFVLKESLLRYPFLGRILRNLDAITVKRQDPRADLRQVLTEGCRHLESGHSVVVFPQSTRSATFNPAAFNSLGVKLARRAGVAIAPFAVKTDLWGNGRWIKDVGPVNPGLPVHLRFGELLETGGNPRAVQQAIIDFIRDRLADCADADRAPEFKAEK